MPAASKLCMVVCDGSRFTEQGAATEGGTRPVSQFDATVDSCRTIISLSGCVVRRRAMHSVPHDVHKKRDIM